MDEFTRSLQKVLVHEGSYSNHPDDPGGATMKGVTQAVYDEYRKKRGSLPVNVKYISTQELEAIYRQNYWMKIHGDELPSGVSYAVFDAAVNSGPKRGAQWLQKALGVEDDGIIGPKTIKAATEYPNKKQLIDTMCDRRLTFLKSLGTWKTFGKGWASRVEGVRKTAKEWVK